MSDLEQQIRERYLKTLDDMSWDEEDPRLDFGVDALPHFAAAFQEEMIEHRRKRLIRIIWQFRDDAALPVLENALRDSYSAVWKEALDGIVTLGGQGALDVLKEARAIASTFADGANRLSWIDEAIEQIQDGI